MIQQKNPELYFHMKLSYLNDGSLDIENCYKEHVWSDGFRCPTVSQGAKQRKKLEILLRDTAYYLGK